MAFDKSVVTLIAAGISALASVANMAFTWQAERRSQYRRLVDSVIREISKEIHEIMVGIKIAITRAEKGKNWSKWIHQAKESGRRLDHLRIYNRYALWELDEGLRVLVRVGSFVEQRLNSGNIEDGKKVYREAEELRKEIDMAIRSIFVKGVAPNRWARKRVSSKASVIRSMYGKQ